MQTEEFENRTLLRGRPRRFESNFNFLDHSAGRIQDLRLLIQKHLVSFLAVINDSKPEDIVTTEWVITHGSTSPHGAATRAHTHPLASWSVVYCASRGDDEPHQSHNMGDIVFYDPRANAAMFLDPTNRASVETSFHSFKITLPGDLLIFPSFITHFVEPYQGEQPRVTVAANYWVNS